MEFQYLRPEIKAALLRACPDFYMAAARFSERICVEKSRHEREALSTADVAALLGITPRAVRLAVRRERLKARGHDADGYLFDQGDVDRYAKTRRRTVVADSECSPVPSTASG